MTSGNDFISLGVERALREQPALARRKNSIAAGAAGVVQLAQIAGVALAGGPWWLSLIIGVVVAVVEPVAQARMKGSITPSMAERITLAADRESAERLAEVTPTAEEVRTSALLEQLAAVKDDLAELRASMGAEDTTTALDDPYAGLR